MQLFSANRGRIDEEQIRTILSVLKSLEKEKSTWEYYNEMAAVEDNIREVEWGDLADTVLIFDGLFAAFLSAFLVFVIPQLQPSSTDVPMDVLIRISQQLSNTSTPAFIPTAPQVSSNSAVVNMLFFLSLASVLIDAFLAMLVKSCLQEFSRGWRHHTVANLRAQEREQRLQEFERWKLDGLVAFLPILTQIALLLFSIGMLMLIFPLHLPSAILCTCAFASVVVSYGFVIYKSVLDTYVPFSSPVSRLFAYGLGILRTWYVLTTPCIPSPLPPQGQQGGAGASHETTHSLPSNKEVVPQSRFDINPHMHSHVLERLLSTTPEVMENIPIFLALLDRPVKDSTLCPYNVEKWKYLLRIPLRLLRYQPTLSVSAAWTLARTMMICYNRDDANRRLCLKLQHHLGSRKADDRSPRVPLNLLFSSYFSFWLDHSEMGILLQTIALLEPSDDADSELLWMVNTFHRAMQTKGGDRAHLNFFVAVLTYVSSTEQSTRSSVPLTTAAIYAMHTIKSVVDKVSDPIDRLFILPGADSVPMTFCPAPDINQWHQLGENCFQFVEELLKWNWGQHWHHDAQISLIAALYIDSSKQVGPPSAFEDLLRSTNITEIGLQNLKAYDHGKLAVHWYMAFYHKCYDENREPIATPYDVIQGVMIEHSTLQLCGLRILEMAVKYVHKTKPGSLDWLNRVPDGSKMILLNKKPERFLREVDPWVLLHLDTLLAPEPYLFPEEVKELELLDTPERVHIANTRLDLYSSHEGTRPDRELLKVFLQSKDYTVCTKAFKICVELDLISQTSPPGVSSSAKEFIPQTIGHAWVEHFLYVLCMDGTMGCDRSWEFLESHLCSKWTLFPSSWQSDFASAFLSSIVQPRDMKRLPAYQYFACEIMYKPTFLPFLETMLPFIKSTLALNDINSFKDWLASIPKISENEDICVRIGNILGTTEQQPVNETLEVLPSS